MKSALVMIPIIIFALFQAVFLPLNLVLLIVIAGAVLTTGKRVYLTAFWGGLILDLAVGQPLGFSSLMFLLFSLVIQLYSRRFDLVHPVVLAVFVLVFNFIYSRVLGRSWLVESAWLVALSFLAAPRLRRFERDGVGLRLGVPK